jgi:hypothetical protein
MHATLHPPVQITTAVSCKRHPSRSSSGAWSRAARVPELGESQVLGPVGQSLLDGGGDQPPDPHALQHVLDGLRSQERHAGVPQSLAGSGAVDPPAAGGQLGRQVAYLDQ